MQTRNPFSDMAQIEDPAYFYNRTQELRKILTNTHNKISCSVVGGHKIGKTSLVRQAMRVTDEDPAWSKYPWVYLHSAWFVGITKSDFYKLLLSHIAYKVAARESDVFDCRRELQSSEVTAAEVDIKLDELVSLDIHPIIVIDEFEATLENTHFDYGFYGVLRSYSPKLTYVTVTERTLDRLSYARTSTATSPFFNIFVVVPVELFSLQDAQGLLLGFSTMGQQPFSAQDIDYLITLAGRHPFFLQRAGFHLFQALESETNVNYDEIATEFAHDAEPHYNSYWDNLTEAQRAVLKKTIPANQLSKSTLDAFERSQAVELTQQALLVEDLKGNYQVVSQALRKFIAEI